MIKKLPVIESCTTVASSRLFTIEELALTFSNGEQRIYERLKRSSSPGAVIVVAMPDPEHFYLVKEYAVGLHEYALWLPKGLKEPGESSVEAANRELQEEIGYAAKYCLELTSMVTAPGYWGAPISVILARDLYASSLAGDEPEPIDVIPWAMDNIMALCQREDFNEARSIAALFYVQAWLQQQTK